MWKLHKKYGVLLVLMISGLLGCSQYDQPSPSQKNKTLKIGLQSGYPPFEFVDETGNVVGFDIDLAKIIAERLGKELVLKDMDFDGEILSLRQGKIDLIISGMEISPTRLKEIQMVPYHGGTQRYLSLIFWGKIPEKVQTFEDFSTLNQGIISVETGTTSEFFLNSYPSIQIRSFEGALAPLMDVKLGKSTANLVESDVAKYLKSRFPEIEILNVPLPENEQTLGFGIGVKKGNEELFQKVHHIIDELKKSGELKKLEDQWFGGGGI